MSGIFWEIEEQPELFKAIGGFTTSVINLTFAIPMFFIDCLGKMVLSLTFMINEMAISGLHCVGIVNMDSSLPPILFLLINLLFLTALNRVPSQQKISNLITLFTTSIWVTVFFTISDDMEMFLYPRLGLMSIAINVGLQFLPEMIDDSSMMENLLKMVMSGFMIISVFGYPNMSGSDEVTSYLCLIPLVLSNVSFFISIKGRGHIGELVVNGTAVMVEDTPDIKRANQSNVQETVKDVEEVVMDIVEEAAKSIVEEDVTNIEDDVKEVEEVDNSQEEVPSTQSAVDNNSPVVPMEDNLIDSESNEMIGEVSEKEVDVEDVGNENEETNTLIEQDAFFHKIHVGLVNWTSKMFTFLTCMMEPVISLPWISILLVTLTTMSQLSLGWAWSHLTSSLFPFLIALPNYPGQLGKVQQLAVAGVTLTAINNGGK